MTAVLLQPVVVLALWTFVMWGWMYATRIPALLAAGIDFRRRDWTSDDLKRLPLPVQWKADNYNHLHEAPTVFYAVVLSLALVGTANGTDVLLAWGYVGLRVVHSLVQSTVNYIPARFLLFNASSLVLATLAVRTALAVF